MKKLKKPAVLALLAVVLLSCVPERVQAGAVTIIQKDKHTVPEQHGESVFDNEDTLHVTCNSNRVEYRTEKDWLGYNIYAEKPFDYCAVRAEGIQEVLDNYENAVYILMISDGPIDYYQVRDGEYDYLYNKSRTTFSGGKRTGCDGREYYVYYGYLKTATNQFWYNCPETPDAAPLYMPPVISVPTDIKTQEEMCQAVLDRLITGDFSDCRVSEGDADNPAQNAPGGIPGSEDNPILDEEIGRLVLESYSLHPDTFANLTGNSTQYYDCIKWKNKTSSGFNLKKSGYPVVKVQVKIKPSATYKFVTGKTDILEAESEDFKLGMFNATDYEARFQFHELVSKYYGTYLVSQSPTSNGSKDELTVNFEYYLRVCVSDSLTVIPTQTTGWKCGPWQRQLICGTYQDKNGSTDSGDFDENGDWVSNGDNEDNYLDDVPTSNDGSDVDGDDVVKKENYDTGDIKSLLSQVGDFPKLIKKLFSFLPQWCLTLFAFGFGCMIVLLLIKTVRG